MIATGATVSNPPRISSPSRSPAPTTSAATIGSTVSAMNTDTRWDSTATRKTAIVRKPVAASIVDLRRRLPLTLRETSYARQTAVSDRFMRYAHGSDAAAAPGGGCGARRRQLHGGRGAAARRTVLAQPDGGRGGAAAGHTALRAHHAPAGTDAGRG